MSDVLQQLGRILAERKSADPRQSYVASLYAQGNEAILKKIMEEAGEVVLAARSADPGAIVHEMADLWFHTLVLLAHAGLNPERVLEELAGRLGRSGLEEKAARKGK